MSTNNGRPLRRRGDLKPPEVRKPSVRLPRHGRAAWEEVCQGAGLTPDEVEFGRAMERFRRERGKSFPTCVDVLEVVKALGYRRVNAADL